MKSPYYLEVSAPKLLGREQREVLVQLLLRVATQFSFLGMKDWEIELGREEKVLGIAEEFHDLTKTHAPENRFTLFFASRKDAGLYRTLLRKSFAELVLGPVKKQQPKDWMKAWRRHYRPVKIGAKKSLLWIYPAWWKVPAVRKRGPYVRIHSGQAFGTGTHGTTALCLELLMANAAKLPESTWRVLDFGAGTGILIFAAEKKAKHGGISLRAQAVEIDPVAREQFRKNARINASRIAVGKTMPKNKSYDLIFANVLAPVLLAERERLLESLAPGGMLLLSGVLASEAPSFHAKFRIENDMTIEMFTKGDWVAFLVRRAEDLLTH